MRKIVMTAVAVGIVAGASAVTVAVVGPSPSRAAPSIATGSCGTFEGSGPAPDCSYRLSGRSIGVSVRNNGTFGIPVQCGLVKAGRSDAVSSVRLGPGDRGTLTASGLRAGRQGFFVDCRSVELSRRASFAVTVESPRSERTTRSRSADPAPRLRSSSSNAPAEPTTRTRPSTTRTTRTGEESAPGNSGPGNTTTTTTTPKA